MTTYALFDNGAGVPKDILKSMVETAQKQLCMFDEAWGFSESAVVNGSEVYGDPEDGFFGVDEDRAKDIVPVFFFAHPDVANAGGYHDKDPHGRAYCKVFTKPYLDNGGSWIDGKDSVSCALTHEICEAENDKPANQWILMPDGRLTAMEACDAVEDTFYNETDTHGRVVAVSNFLLPDWSSEGSEGPYDYLGLLKKPFTMTSGGYWLITQAGRIKQEFGSEMPDWRRALKVQSHRMARRVAFAHEGPIAIFDPNTSYIDPNDPNNRMKPRILIARAKAAGITTFDRAPTIASNGEGNARGMTNISAQSLGSRASKPVNNSGQKLGKRTWK